MARIHQNCKKCQFLFQYFPINNFSKTKTMDKRKRSSITRAKWWNNLLYPTIYTFYLVMYSVFSGPKSSVGRTTRFSFVVECKNGRQPL